MRTKYTMIIALASLALAAPAQAAERIRVELPRRSQAEASFNGGFSGVSDTTMVPYRYVGQLFVKFRGEPVASCTATAIDSPSRRLVLTAGHCVVEVAWCGRRRCALNWPQWIRFIPGRSFGLAPFGVFYGRQAMALRPYVRALKHQGEPGNSNFDIGAVIVDGPVADAVDGGATVGQGLARNQEFELIGYPGRRQRQMHRCEGVFSGDDRRSYRRAGPPTLRANCSMRHGASGGPWFIAGTSIIDGLTSYGYDNRDQDGTYGPYFSADTVGELLTGL